MSDYIHDMKDVTEHFNLWCDTHALLDNDFRAIDTLLQKHYDDRAALFEEMLKVFDRQDGLEDQWKAQCEKGLALLDRLNSAIAQKVEKGLEGIGLGTFFRGEQKIWTVCSSGLIGAIADGVVAIAQNDDELTKQLEEDLKKAREEGQVADEAVRLTFGDNKESMRQFALQAIEKGATKVVSEIPLIGEKLSPLATSLMDTVRGSSAKIRDAAKRKQAYKKVLISNREKIDAVSKDINDDRIKNLLKAGSEWVANLKSIGADGDYKAADWELLGKECQERLKNFCDMPIEKAQKLFQTVRPAYMEGLVGAFATLASTPDNLQAYKSELDEHIQEVFEDLRKDQEVVSSLRDSSIKTKAWQDLETIQQGVTEAIKQLRDSIKDAEEDMLIS